jgi:hypothetical protein
MDFKIDSGRFFIADAGFSFIRLVIAGKFSRLSGFPNAPEKPLKRLARSRRFNTGLKPGANKRC